MINQLLILLLCWYFKVLNSFLRYSKIVLIGILLVYQRYGVFINLGLQRDLQSCFILIHETSGVFLIVGYSWISE